MTSRSPAPEGAATASARRGAPVGRPVRVGIDASTWTNPRGFGRFTRNAVTRLIELDADSTYILYTDQETAGSIKVPRHAQCRVVRQARSPADVLSHGGTRHPADIVRMTWAVREDSLSAFLFPSLLSYFPVFGVPKVVGVHDTTAIEFPHLVFRSRWSTTLSAVKARTAIATAAALFTVSESAKADIVRRLRIDEQRLTVVPEAPAPVFYPRAADVRQRCYERIGLDNGDPFLLYAGGINPHKNVGTLVDAYAELRRRVPQAPALVLAGDLDGSYVSAAPHILARIDAARVRDHVLLPGFVSDETLACLYSGAVAVVIPSLAEGFSLPPVEAAACGAPVVVSDLAVHREVLQDAALYFRATDVPALVRALAAVISDAGLRERLTARGRAVTARLSWDTAALSLRELISQVASR